MLDKSSRGKDSPNVQLKKFLCSQIVKPIGGGTLVGAKTVLEATKGVYYHAFGSFIIEFSGSYCCNQSRKCKFKGTWNFSDRYDWHQGARAVVLNTVIEGDWALLVEKYRGAKPFMEEGKWEGAIRTVCPCNNESESEE